MKINRNGILQTTTHSRTYKLIRRLRITENKNISKKYNISLDDIEKYNIDSLDKEYLSKHGCFPDDFSELKGNYNT